MKNRNLQETEIWKPIFNETINKDLEELDGIFLVSNLGRVKNGLTDKMLKPSIWTDYYVINLEHTFDDGYHLKKTINLHRLVACAFIPNPNNLPLINHKDENKLNNNASNLEWCTHSYNRQYGNSVKKMIQTQRENGRIQKIIQLSHEGKYITTYEWIKEVPEDIGGSTSNIYRCCRRIQKRAKNYVFLFEKDYVLIKNEDGSVDKELLENASAFRIRRNQRRDELKNE